MCCAVTEKKKKGEETEKNNNCLGDTGTSYGIAHYCNDPSSGRHLYVHCPFFVVVLTLVQPRIYIGHFFILHLHGLLCGDRKKEKKGKEKK